MVELERKIIVQKYGDSSLADEQKIRIVAQKIQTALKEGYRLVVVVSASCHLNVSFNVEESIIDDVKATYEDVFEDHQSVVIKAETGYAKISVVGLGMRTESGVASRFFSALAKGSINVKMVTTSEIKISVLIPQEQLEDAVICLSEEFELCSE